MKLGASEGRGGGECGILATAFDSLPDVVLLFDSSGLLAGWNARAEELLPRFAKGLHIGQSVAEVTARLGKTDDVPVSQMTRHGPGGELVMTVRVQEPVVDYERLVGALSRFSIVGVAMVRPGGVISQSSPALNDVLGFEDGELLGSAFPDRLHPMQRTEAAAAIDRLIAGQGDHFDTEWRLIRKTGESFRARLTAAAVDSDDGAFAIVSVEDIEERRRNEESLSMFSAVVESSAEAVVIMMPDGHPVYINPAHRKLFGLSLTKERRKRYRHHFSEETQRRFPEEILPHLRRFGNWEGVLDARDAEGRAFPLWQRLGMVRDKVTDRPVVYFGFSHDHTRQQGAENELRRAMEEAERANQTKTRFLAAASHDLRQPLQALAMFVAVLTMRNSDPDNRALIGRIEESLNVVVGLLSGLLDVSKLEAGLVVPHIGVFSISTLLSRLGDELRPLAREAGLDLRVMPCRIQVQSDPALLERILRNLLVNAIRYTPRGRILFGCRRRADRLRIEIWDTGIGIPEGHKREIFEEFHQLNNPARDRRKGLGLGLAIVDRLAKLLNHPVDVVSKEKSGSVFFVDVPIADVANTVAKPLAPAPAARGHALLLVENEEDVLESTRLLLSSWGYDVLAVPDGEAALAELAATGFAPDLILLDVPPEKGAPGPGATIRRLRERIRPFVPVVVLAGDTAPECLLLAEAEGHSLLRKPVHPATLRRTIEEMLSPRPVAWTGTGP